MKPTRSDSFSLVLVRPSAPERTRSTRCQYCHAIKTNEPEISPGVFQDEDISSALPSVKNVANNSLISINFLSFGFPEFFKVIATHSMDYTSRIFFHYHI